jgi:hypothetical protein
VLSLIRMSGVKHSVYHHKELQLQWSGTSLHHSHPSDQYKKWKCLFSVLFLKCMDLLALYFNFFLAVLGKEMRKWSRRDFAAFMWHGS